MESEKHLRLFKDTLELVRNHVFGLGLLAIAAAASYQTWSVAPGWTASRVTAALGLLGVGYVIASTVYFIVANQPPKERRLARSAWVIFMLAGLTTTVEVCSVIVLRYEAWQHSQQVAANHAAPSHAEGASL